MGSELIYNLNNDTQPFITFNVQIRPNQIISCVGYEFICANPKCDCQSINIGVSPKGSRDMLTYISYGWRDYDYYLNKGHPKDYARNIIQGKLNESERETEQNKSILLVFRSWLSRNKVQNDQILADRYKQFKLAVRNRQMSKERNTKLKKLFSLMMELFGEEKVEEFIAGCEQPSKIGHIPDSKKKSIGGNGVIF